jgi:Flp pilus assembly protein TadD
MNAWTDQALERARAQLQHGQVDGAIDTLTSLLGEDPDDARAHAVLAFALLRRKRLHAARHEAGRALELDPHAVLSHLAAAGVAVAERRFTDAELHLETARAGDPGDERVHEGLARLYFAWGRSRQALEHGRQACELAPEDDDCLALRAQLEFAAGQRGPARAFALHALEINPENVEALCVLGHCDLADGQDDAARQHAAWALQADPMSESALTLLAAIKARRSLLLGLWWRFQAFVSAGSRTRAIALLVGIYLLYRITLIVLGNHQLGHWNAPLNWAWLGFCAYTWFAPALFWKAVRRELQQVRLRPEF